MNGVMESVVSFDRALAALGDKTVEGIVHAVEGARDDLAEYRSLKQDWVSEASPTGLANWISDRVWARLRVLLDDVSEADLRAQGHTREIWIGTQIRVRVKRHDQGGRVASYPTRTARFVYDLDPDEAPFDGLDATTLTAGYVWDPETRQIGTAILALSRELGSKAEWMEELPNQDGVALRLHRPSTDGPTPPVVLTALGEDHRRVDDEDGAGT